MWLHLIKTLWKRKTKHLLISAEICLIFMVIFAVVAGVSYNTRLFQRPLGFEVEDRWRVAIEWSQLSNSNGNAPQADAQWVENVKRSLAALPEVEALSFMQFTPYSNSAFRSYVNVPQTEVKSWTYMLRTDDDAARTLGLQLSAGRWFSAADEGADQPVVVIDRQLANELFPQQNPLGQLLSNSTPQDKSPVYSKVIGVVEGFRYRGEFMDESKIVLQRHSPLTQAPLGELLIKVKPGTPRHFEIKLHQQLKLVRNDANYRISTLAEERAEILRQKKVFFSPPVMIAVFLLIMVSFGLFGVLWQNTQSRIPEMGLRRAVGASRFNIYGQIIAEQALLCSLAMAVGLLFLIQLPLTGIMAKFMDWQSFFMSVGISMLIVYAMSLMCSLYPAWRASQLDPSEALRYE